MFEVGHGGGGRAWEADVGWAVEVKRDVVALQHEVGPPAWGDAGVVAHGACGLDGARDVLREVSGKGGRDSR